MGILLSLTENTKDTEYWFPTSRDWGGNPDQASIQLSLEICPDRAEYLAWFLLLKKSGQTLYLCELWEL